VKFDKKKDNFFCKKGKKKKVKTISEMDKLVNLAKTLKDNLN